MTLQKDLLIITASNGENRKLAEKLKLIGSDLTSNSHLIDLTEIKLPMFNPRLSKPEEISRKIQSLYDQMNSYSHWFICAPEYNGSIPPLLTNLIAWLSTESEDFRSLFNGRPIGIGSYSGGNCMSLLISMRIQLSHLGAQVLGRQIISNNSKPVQDKSIKEVLALLLQMKALN